jgi:hypothetical protein
MKTEISNFRSVASSKYLEIWKKTKLINTILLSVTHHRENPLDSVNQMLLIMCAAALSVDLMVFRTEMKLHHCRYIFYNVQILAIK